MLLCKRKFSNFFLFLICLSVAPSVFSASNAPEKDQRFFSPNVMTFSMGPAWAHSGDSDTFTLAPGIQKTYDANNTTQAIVDGELFLGRGWMLSEQYQSQLGLAVATTEAAKLSGNVWDDANPQFNNYTYQYKMKHTHFAVKGKLLLDSQYSIKPWISASFGLGFNQTENFSNSPTIFEAIVMPNFQTNTQSTFTYTIGLGLQCITAAHWQVGVGYEFADWGRSELSPAPSQTMGSGISQSHFYTNGLMLNITYLS